MAEEPPQRFSLRLGALAVTVGYVTQADLEEALNRQKEMKNRGEYRPLGSVLVELGKLSPEQLDDLLSKQDEAWTGHRTVGRYRLLRKIGEGGMGSVWKAEHEDLGNTVAIKLLPRAVVSDEQLVERFHQEARVMATINHTNIVQAFDAGEENGQPYFVMPFLTGATLGDVLRNKGRLATRTALSISLQILRGLQYAHDHGLVHRDLKPDNVAITNDGTVKILDLGLTKLMESTAIEAQRRTRSGHIVGTPHHMSPEQILGDPNIDGRSDIYSLGSTLFQMVCGREPFAGKTIGEVLRPKLDKPPPDPSSINPDLSSDVRKLILRMLARRAADRPQDCQSVEREVEVLLDGKPITGPALAPASIVMGRSEAEADELEARVDARKKETQHKQGTTRHLRKPPSDGSVDPSATTMMPWPPDMVGKPEGKSTKVLRRGPPRLNEREIETVDFSHGGNLMRDAMSNATTRRKQPLDPEPEKPTAEVEAKDDTERHEDSTPRISVGWFGQAVAAVILVVVTVLITLAVVNMLKAPEKAPKPEVHGR